MKTVVTKIDKEGTRSEAYVFVNELHPVANLITAWLLLHKIGNVLNEDMQRMAMMNIKIGRTKRTAHFELGEDIYIVLC